MNIRYGGVLKSGDFIVVGRQGYFDLGWFIKEGKNTVHYYCFRRVGNYLRNAEEFNAKMCKTHAGISYAGNVIKVIYPEEILVLPNDFEAYVKGSEILKNLKLI
jgi:hypothetical protein